MQWIDSSTTTTTSTTSTSTTTSTTSSNPTQNDVTTTESSPLTSRSGHPPLPPSTTATTDTITSIASSSPHPISNQTQTTQSTLANNPPIAAQDNATVDIAPTWLYIVIGAAACVCLLLIVITAAVCWQRRSSQTANDSFQASPAEALSVTNDSQWGAAVSEPNSTASPSHSLSASPARTNYTAFNADAHLYQSPLSASRDVNNVYVCGDVKL